MGLDIKKKVRLKLNFSGDVTTSVDRPIYERVKDGDTFKNAFNIEEIPSFVGIINGLIKDTRGTPTQAGIDLFKTFYFS